MIFISKYLVPKGYTGMTIFPFVFLKTAPLKENQVLINHEKIHLRQQQELLIIPFYMLYITEWLLRTIWYLDSYRAYQNISFEREAYGNENQSDYLSQRKPFSFIKYLCS